MSNCRYVSQIYPDHNMELCMTNHQLVQPLGLLLKSHPAIVPKTWIQRCRISEVQWLDIPNRSDRCPTFPGTQTKVMQCQSCSHSYMKKSNETIVILARRNKMLRGKSVVTIKYIRPLTRNIAQKAGVLRFVAGQSIGGNTPHFSDIFLRAAEWLLCFGINVVYIWIWAYVLTH